MSTETNPAGATSTEGRSDPLYPMACMVVRVQKRAAISTVQRHLRIGYNRAALLLEAMVGDVIAEMPPTTKLLPARGMEVRSIETEGLDPKGDSPVPQGRAQSMEEGVRKGAPVAPADDAAAWDFDLWLRRLMWLVDAHWNDGRYHRDKSRADIRAHAENVGMFWRSREFLAERGAALSAAAPVEVPAEPELSFVQRCQQFAEQVKAAPLGTAVRMPADITDAYRKFVRGEPSPLDDIVAALATLVEPARQDSQDLGVAASPPGSPFQPPAAASTAIPNAGDER